MVDAFDRCGFKVPVKLGHDEKSGDRSWGWVKAIRRVGSKLVADITDIPSSLFKLIKEKAYDAVSAEIFWDIERNGEVFKRCLRAVALLGAEIPAVSDLAPISAAEMHSTRSRRAFRYKVPFNYSALKESPMSTNNDPGQAFLDAVNEYIYTHNVSWDVALRQVRASEQGQKLIRQYGEATGPMARRSA
jgi:hypothetical protein